MRVEIIREDVTYLAEEVGEAKFARIGDAEELVLRAAEQLFDEEDNYDDTPESDENPVRDVPVTYRS